MTLPLLIALAALLLWSLLPDPDRDRDGTKHNILD